ncbi:DUF6416 domain-containing protein [Actinoallomurus soli]|uniref:DUF6416 domain-containing protein n=1 Tax=Actinoallomurus soli TaxID=2952535 RepID=UPI002093B105|nr:DUF6416 domain-containing protein [Actinoallomurus soli]MCO5968940.1 DUF6416 domain-containing protein [Actinoallomurus soli]
MILTDDDPMWSKESGGHQGPEWGPDDRDLAATQDQLPTSTYLIHKVLVDHPGQMLSVPELIELTGNRFKNAHAVASALQGYSAWCKQHDRIFPFSWWAGRNGRATHYAMKPRVAALFREARQDR